MKQFNTILDAIHFNTHCPLCQGELRSDSFTNLNQKIALHPFSNKHNDTIHIDIITQDIEIVNDSGWFQNSNSSGTLGQSFLIACYDCCMYAFRIQIWINLNTKSIIQITLNSEEVSWEDENNVLHEIISVYPTNKTKYSYYGSNTSKDDGQIILPFVPVDVSNPKDAVVRIQKLIVFS